MRFGMKVIAFLLLVCYCVADYDQKLALELSFYARITYKLNDVKSWKCSGCERSPLVDRVDFINQKHSLFGYAGYSTKVKAIVIAFRGTVLSWHNIITNIDYFSFQYKKAPAGKVHRSFYRDFQRIRDPFINKVNQLCKKYPETDIYVTGHSLGGALAVFAATQLSDYQDITAVYTFGEPRLGNKKFAEYVDKKLDVYRVINRNDIVPSLPPRTSPFLVAGNKAKDLGKKTVSGIKKAGTSVKKGASSLFKKARKFFHLKRVQTHQSFINFSYYHEGYQIWYVPEDKTVYDCYPEDKQCHDSVPTYKKSVKDHLIRSYMNSIETAIKEKWKFE